MNTSRFRLRGFSPRSVWIALLLAAGVSAITNAQGINSSGTDFWAGFFPNEQLQGDTQLTELFLASTAADTALVTFDGQTTAWPLAANSVQTVNLFSRGVTEIPETPIDRSVHIQTHAPITVYGFYDTYGFGSGGSPDGFLGLPNTSLGQEYYTVNYTEFNNFAGTETAEFLVIAPYDSTLVTITTTAHTQSPTRPISHSPGDTWSVMLMKGQSYLVQSSGQFSGIDDLTGSHVVSSKPVGLLTGHQMADIPLSMGSADYLIEMEPPADRWGTEYFEMPMAGRTICGDYIRILSAEDSNAITANGVPIAKLNAGQWMEIDTVTTPQFYRSSNGKRFIVAQYSYSAHYLNDPVPADPFLILLTGEEEFERRILFRTPDPAQGASYANYVTILAPQNSMGLITINGTAATSYPSAGQSVFPGTTIAALRILLPNGSNSYLATSPVPFGMYQYGISDYEGYGWPAGLALNLHSLDSLPPSQLFSKTCCNYNVTIFGTRAPHDSTYVDRIADVTMITQAGDPRWSKPSSNYTFTLDPTFQPGDSTAHFSLAIKDPNKSAYAAVYTIDFSGNDTVYQYSSSPQDGHSYQHLAIRSGLAGQQVTMPMAEDIGDTAFLLTSWKNLTSLTATISFDSSKLAFQSINPPAGWTMGTTTNHGNSVTFVLNNAASSPARPLDMGSAVFQVKDVPSGMTLIVLNDLQFYVGSSVDALCLGSSEDEMWGIEIVRSASGVGSAVAPGRVAVRPNPFEDHLIVDDPGNTITAVEIFDALGREMISGTNLSDVHTSALLPGTYVVVCHTRTDLQTFHVSKPR